jgi:DNA modification methylase
VNDALHPQKSFNDLPPPQFIGFGELVSISLGAVTNPLTHGLHRYPAKFIPQIPRWAIREYSSPGDTVLDPFSGSGTTLVEGVATDRNVLGVDLDPLACMISRAKTANIDVARLSALAEQLLEFAHEEPAELRVPMRGVRNFEHWFTTRAWADLQAIRRGIDRLDCSPSERLSFLVLFSSILRNVSNADDQTQKTYVSGTLKKTPPPVVPTFVKRIERALSGYSDLNAVRASGRADVVEASATSLPFLDGQVDLMVTSPPYMDSVDYMYNLMLEYFWLGPELGIETRQDFNNRRRAYVGAKSPAENAQLPGGVADLIDLQTMPAYRRASVAPYFASMARHFREAARVLKSGGRYVITIGNSRTQDGMLPLHDALIVLAHEEGLHLEHAFGYRIRRHYMKFPRKGRGGIILMDWVITLRKSEKGGRPPERLPFVDAQLAPDAVAH